MLEEARLLELSAKRSLDASDACALLQLLHEQTTPILSLRCAVGSTAAPAVRLTPASGERVSTSRGINSERRRSREGGRGRDGGSRAVSPKRALFGGASTIDLGNLNEFPPIQPSPATSTNNRSSLHSQHS